MNKCNDDNLSPTELKFIKQHIRREKYYYYFCLMDIVAAFGILIYITMVGSFDVARLILSLMLLINAKSNLKQYKNSKILKKLFPL